MGKNFGDVLAGVSFMAIRRKPAENLSLSFGDTLVR